MDTYSYKLFPSLQWVFSSKYTITIPHSQTTSNHVGKEMLRNWSVMDAVRSPLHRLCSHMTNSKFRLVLGTPVFYRAQYQTNDKQNIMNDWKKHQWNNCYITSLKKSSQATISGYGTLWKCLTLQTSRLILPFKHIQ